jgi:purine-cytosine permease-like protein
MNFIGYWLAIYEGISLCDHFFFKKGFSGYNPELYSHAKSLPPGIAAIGAFCFGVAGMVTGMSQVSLHSRRLLRNKKLIHVLGVVCWTNRSACW